MLIEAYISLKFGILKKILKKYTIANGIVILFFHYPAFCRETHELKPCTEGPCLYMCCSINTRLGNFSGAVKSFRKKLKCCEGSCNDAMKEESVI